MSGSVLVLVAFVAGVFFKALSDLMTEELRGWIDLGPRGILCLAAARVEQSQRETVYKKEWLPALASSVRGTETRPLTRLVKGMTFAIGRLIFVWRSPGDVTSTSLTPRVSGAPVSQPLPARYLQPHGRFKIVKARGVASRGVASRGGMSRCDLVWRVAVGIGRSSGMTRVFLQIRVIPGASPWSSLPLLLLIASRLRLLRRAQSPGSVMTC